MVTDTGQQARVDDAPVTSAVERGGRALARLAPDDRIAVDHRRLVAHLDFVPTSVVGNFVNAVLVVLPFYRTMALSSMLLIVLGVWAGTGALLVFARRARPMPRAAASRLLRDAGFVALAMGTIWAAVIYSLMQAATPTQVTMLGMLAAGMMAAAALASATTPWAVSGFALPIAVAMVAALAPLRTPESTVTVAFVISFVLVLLRGTAVTFAGIVDRLIGQVRLADHARAEAEHAATVRLLLNDFEAHGADWLWEIDGTGAIVDPSPRFVDAAGVDAEALAGASLVALFAACPERDALAEHLRAATAFRDLAVPLNDKEKSRWWSLSGHPTQRADGSLRMRGVATDVSAAKNAEIKVAYMAHYDALTDLPNRFLFTDTLSRALARQRPSMRTVLMSLDLDHFKSVNDTLGHPAGDLLLKIVSRRIEGCLRERDVVARMGGDEFCILLTGVRDDGTAERTATRILRALSEPIELDGHQVLAAASIGIVVAPRDGSHVEQLMKNVDLALYSAKADGRNRYAFFAPAMDEAAQARRMVEMDLRGALSHDELSLSYQPLVDVATGETVGYEALLRWHHPDRGLVMPSTFVPIAEESGLIVQLGEWVIRKAIAEAAQWPVHLSVSINLSPLQMKSGSLITTIMNALATAQIDPARVEFEITESVLMHETEANLATLHKLRALGVRIALDDFGTGYSSLNYLRSFPFDKIKIDRCFVQGVEHREDCQAIVRAVTGLASSLGMITTAEGVETEAQYARLRTDGCTQVQGFLFSPPVAADALTDLRTSYGDEAHRVPVALLPAIEAAVFDRPAPGRRRRA